MNHYPCSSKNVTTNTLFTLIHLHIFIALFTKLNDHQFYQTYNLCQMHHIYAIICTTCYLWCWLLTSPSKCSWSTNKNILLKVNEVTYDNQISLFSSNYSYPIDYIATGTSLALSMAKETSTTSCSVKMVIFACHYVIRMYRFH